MIIIGINVLDENDLDKVIDTIIKSGTVEDCKALIMHFIEEDPRMSVASLAGIYLGIHASNFSPSATGRWRKALEALMEEGQIIQCIK